MASFAISITCLLLLKDFHTVLGSNFGISINPSGEIVKNAGEELTVLCQIGVPLDICIIKVGDIETSFKPGKKDGYISYYGRGFESGQCGINISKIEPHYTGDIVCKLAPATNAASPIVHAQVKLIVTKQPSPPDLRRSPELNSYKENDLLNASCTVRDGRPVSSILWYLGDNLITEGLTRPVIYNSTSSKEPYVQTIQQNLSRVLQSSDNGKDLKCVAKHPALPPNKNSSFVKLTVEFPPKPLPKPVERFGLVEGTEGRVVVSIVANPKPQFTWKVDETEIREGRKDPTGRFTAEAAKTGDLKDPANWESVLLIESLTKDDVTREYKLVARNKYGEAEYPVQISTSPGPKTVEMGAGTIAAIVVAVLVILLITIILVVARAKGRWCFAGKAGVVRGVGESSDTESAENHGDAKSKMIFTSVFKKKGDKVSSETVKGKDVVNVEKNGTAEDDGESALKPKSEEGIVYAELDLKNSPASHGLLVKPENDKTEYAEIIHTRENK